MRLLYVIGLIVLLTVAVVLVHLQFGAPPDPRLGGCDPNNVAGSQALELQQLSNWLLWRELLGAVLVSATVYLLFYFQAFHELPAPIAWLGRAIVVGILAVFAGLSVKGLAQSWVSNSSGTCLSEAIQTDPSNVATVGRLVPVAWPWAVCADGMMLALLGAVAGLLAYSVARQARV
jgi:hypothetical protein